MDALEIMAAVTSAGRFSLALKEAVNGGAGAVSPFRITQAGHITPNDWLVDKGSMLTLKSLPLTPSTPVGSNCSTDKVVSSIGTTHRCYTIGVSVG